jgi:hypothetical protein
MNRSRFAGILIAALAVALPLAAQRAKKAEAPASPAIAEDKGRFRVTVDGQPTGSEDFTISRAGNEWIARGTVDIPGEGGISKLTSKLRLAADGSPIAYEYDWTPAVGKKIAATATFQDGNARVETQFQGTTPFVQEFKFDSPRVAILDNNLHHQYAILARLYDWDKKGAQDIPVLIPQLQTPGVISVHWLGPQDVNGTKLDLLRVRSAELEVDAYFDSARRLMRISVPASKAEVIRE